jgi:hypothetical protein
LEQILDLKVSLALLPSIRKLVGVPGVPRSSHSQLVRLFSGEEWLARSLSGITELQSGSKPMSQILFSNQTSSRSTASIQVQSKRLFSSSGQFPSIQALTSFSNQVASIHSTTDTFPVSKVFNFF